MTDESLVALANAAGIMAKPGFTFGEWAGGETRADGVITMPWYQFSAEGLQVIRAMPVRMGFDWPAWKDTAEAIGLATDHSKIASATAEQLVKLCTLLRRQDRFVEGLLAHAYESGLLLAIAQRAAALTGEDQPEAKAR